MSCLYLLYYFITLLLCAFDYINVYIGKQQQRIWPIYHWALGFEKIPTIIYRGDVKVILCDSKLLEKPISLEKFIKSQRIKWKYSQYYKYLLIMATNKDNEQNLKAQKSLESHLLSRLSCNKLVYSLFLIKKFLKTKKESKRLLKTIEYRKLIE